MKNTKENRSLLALLGLSMLACTGYVEGPDPEESPKTKAPVDSKSTAPKVGESATPKPKASNGPSPTQSTTNSGSAKETTANTSPPQSGTSAGKESPPQGNAAFSAILSKATFEQMFAQRSKFYTYEGLVEATNSYAAFATTGDETARKREVAAFLANAAHETGGLVYIEEIQKAEYCSPSESCPCAPGKSYFGRGPIQLSWNYNYCAAGRALGIPLSENPDLVAQDPKVAWQTTLWFWMTQSGAGTMTAHKAIGSVGFGETIRTINGARECNGGNAEQVASRQNYYREFTRLLGVEPGENLGC